MIPTLALDVSIRSTGYATHVDLGDGIAEHICGLIVPEARRNGRTIKLEGIARLPAIASQIRGLVTRHGIRLVAIENYAFGMQSVAVTKLAELGGVVRTTLWSLQVPYIEVASTAIKAYAVGRGRADKDEMVAAAREDLGYRGTFRHPRDRQRIWSSDVADAMWLHALVADALGQPYAPDLASPQLRDKRRQAVATVVPLLPRNGVLTPPTNPHQEH